MAKTEKSDGRNRALMAVFAAVLATPALLLGSATAAEAAPRLVPDKAVSHMAHGGEIGVVPVHHVYKAKKFKRYHKPHRRFFRGRHFHGRHFHGRRFHGRHFHGRDFYGSRFHGRHFHGHRKGFKGPVFKKSRGKAKNVIIFKNVF